MGDLAAENVLREGFELRSFILSFNSVPTSSLIGLGLCGGGNKLASLMQLRMSETM
jgi:hypothetical protein